MIEPANHVWHQRPKVAAHHVLLQAKNRVTLLQNLALWSELNVCGCLQNYVKAPEM